MGKVHRRGTGYTVDTLKKRHKRPCASAPSTPTNVSVDFVRKWVRRHVAWRARVTWDAVDTDVAGRPLTPEVYEVQLRAVDASGDPVETSLQESSERANGSAFALEGGSAPVVFGTRELNASGDIIRKTLTGLTDGIESQVTFYASKDLTGSAPVLRYSVWNATDGVEVVGGNRAPESLRPRAIVSRSFTPATGKTYEARVEFVSGTGVGILNYVQWHDKGNAAVWRKRVESDDTLLAVFGELPRPKAWYFESRARVLNRVHGGRCWSAWSDWTTAEIPATGTLEGPDPVDGLVLSFDRVEGAKGNPWRAKAAWNTSPAWTPTDGDEVDIDGYDVQLRVYKSDGTTLLNTRRGIFVEHNLDELTSRTDFGNIRGRRNYSVRVRPRALGRPGAWTSWTAIASPGGTPEPPTNVDCEERTPRDVLVTWDPPTDLTDVDGYRVRIIRQGSGTVVEERTIGGALSSRYHWKVPRSEVDANPGADYRARVFSVEQPYSDAIDEDAPSEGDFDNEELSATYAESTDTTIDGVWDPTEVPANPSDGNAPASSPAPELIAGLGVLHARWDAVSNADIVTYEVHVSTTTGFTPGPTTLYGETGGTALTIKALADGSALEYGTDYFVKTVAKDADGAAAASSQAVRQTAQVNTADIVAQAITTDLLAANAITADRLAAVLVLTSVLKTSESGRRVEVDTDGIRLVASDDTVLVNLPTDPSTPAAFTGELLAQALTATGPVELRSASNLVTPSAALTLAIGQQPPSAAPGLSQSVPSRVVSWTDDAGEVRGAWHDGTNQFTFYSDNAAGTYFNTVEKRSADAASIVATATVAKQSTSDDLIGNMVKVGTAWFGLFYRHDTAEWLWQTFASDGNGLPGTRQSVGTWAQATGGYYRAALAVDGTNIKVGQSNKTLTGGDLKAWLGTYTTSGSAVPTFSTSVTSADTRNWGGIGCVSLYYGNADYGAARWVFKTGAGFIGVYNTTPTRQADSEWVTSTTTGPLWWDGSNFNEAVVGSHLAYKYTTFLASSGVSDQFWLAFTWYDSAGTVHETTLSPRSTLTLVNRRQLSVTWPTIPSGGADDPNAVRIYMKEAVSDPGSSFASYFRQGSSFTGTQTALVAYSTTTAGSQAAAFPSAVPAEIRSSGGEPLLRGNGYSRCRVRYTAAGNVSNDADRYVRFGTEDVDTDGYHASTTDAINATPDSTYNIVLPFAGQYLIVFRCTWAAGSGGFRQAFLDIGPGTIERMTLEAGGSTLAIFGNATWDVDVAAGTIVRVGVRQDSGVSLALNNARVFVLYLGPA